jgi:heme/copper-type cytochrome/quinol oxidase subunit 2
MAEKEYGEVAYILGIVSLVFAFISPVAGLIIGIIGFSHGKKEKTALAERGKKLSRLAIIISIIILAITIAVAVYTGVSSLDSLSLS